MQYIIKIKTTCLLYFGFFFFLRFFCCFSSVICAVIYFFKRFTFKRFIRFEFFKRFTFKCSIKFELYYGRTSWICILLRIRKKTFKREIENFAVRADLGRGLPRTVFRLRRQTRPTTSDRVAVCRHIRACVSVSWAFAISVLVVSRPETLEISKILHRRGNGDRVRDASVLFRRPITAFVRSKIRLVRAFDNRVRISRVFSSDTDVYRNGRDRNALLYPCRRRNFSSRPNFLYFFFFL